MKLRTMSVIATLILFVTTYSYAEVIKMPYPAEESWILTQGYLGDKNPDDPEVTHENYGLWCDDRYALDFAYPTGCGTSWGRIVLAPVSGTVESVQYSQTGYGNNFLINEGDGHKTRLAHYEIIFVQDGQYVVQGEPTGLCGNTGLSIGSANCLHSGSHIHMARYLNGVGIPFDSLSGYTSMIEDSSYASDNVIDNTNGVGLYADGWHNDSSSYATVQAYIRASPEYDLGIRYNNYNGGVVVHLWYSQDGTAFVIIQDFCNPETGLHSAIIYNERMKMAFVIKEGFRWYYMDDLVGYGPSILNAPKCDEESWVDTHGWFGQVGAEYMRQDFETQKTLLWKIDETEDVRMVDTPNDNLAYEGSVSIASLPEFKGWPLDAHRIYVTWPHATNRAYLDLYANDVFIKRLYDEDEYIIEGLDASTSYMIKALVYDTATNLLQTLGPLQISTEAIPIIGVENMDINVYAGTDFIRVDFVAVNNASEYHIIVDDVVAKVTTDLQVTVWGITSGQTYKVQVKAYTAGGMLVGQSSAVNVTCGQQVLFYPISGPTQIGPNGIYTVIFRLYNQTSYPLSNFVFRVVYFNQDESWFVFPSTFEDPVYVGAGSYKDIPVTFSTNSGWAVADSIDLNAYFVANCQVGNLSSIDKSATFRMKVASYSDLIPGLRIETATIRTGDRPVVHISCSNQSNTATPEGRYHLYLSDGSDWVLIGDILIPALEPLETFATDITMEAMETGLYQLKAIADPQDLIFEGNEENNTVLLDFEVVDASITTLELLEQKLVEDTVLKIKADQIEIGDPSLQFSIGGNPTLCQGYDGQSNTAVNFDEKGEFYRIEPHVSLDNPQRTVIIVWKPNNTTGWVHIVGSCDKDKRREGLSSERRDDGFYDNFGTTNSASEPMHNLMNPKPYKPDEWRLSVATQSAVEKCLYGQGELEVCEPVGRILPAATAPWYIGKSVWEGVDYGNPPGVIAEIWLLDEVLTAEEVKLLYQFYYQEHFEQESAEEQAAVESADQEATSFSESSLLNADIGVLYLFDGTIDSIEKKRDADANPYKDLQFVGNLVSCDGINQEPDSGIDFVDASAVIKAPFHPDYIAPEMTIEALVEFGHVNGTQAIVVLTEKDLRAINLVLKDGKILGDSTSSATSPLTYLSGDRVLQPKVPYLLTFVQSASGREIRINGAWDASDGVGNRIPNTSPPLTIGAGPWEGALYNKISPGSKIYFVRISNIARPIEDTQAIAQDLGLLGK